MIRRFSVVGAGLRTSIHQIVRRLLLLAAALTFAGAGQLIHAAPDDLYVTNPGSGDVVRLTSGGAQSNIASGINGAWGLAFDAAGNLFVAEAELNGEIIRIAPDGSTTVFASGISAPVGLAFDGAGNLFVSSQYADGSGQIIKLTPAGARSVFVSSIPAPYDLAFDSAGNLFVATNSSLGIVEVFPDGTQSAFAPGQGYIGLAFDAAGSLFASSGDIFKFTPAGTRTLFASGLPGGLEDLAFDAAGNLFATTFFGNVLKITPDGSTSTVAVLSNANGVAIEPAVSAPVSFAPPTLYGAGSGPNSVAVADFNGDGKPDLAVADQGGGSNPSGANILLGNGDGTLQTGTLYGAGTQPRFVQTADLNRDGRTDLIVANFADNDVSVLLGNGDGTFSSATNYPLLSGSCSPICAPVFLALGDLNGDHNPDVVVADWNGDNVQILIGNGDGTLRPAIAYDDGNHFGVNLVTSVALGDLNHDGKLDIVATIGGSNPGPNNSLAIMLGNGDGTLQAPVTYPIGVNANPQSIAIGDLNGDGNLDLAVADFNDRCSGGGCYVASVFLGNGDGTVQPVVDYAVGGANPQSVALSDFNGDGKLDIVTANSFGGNVSVLIGNGDGTFATEINFVAGARPVSVAVGDLNLDGRPDIAVASSIDGTVSVLLNTSATTATNHPPVARSESVTVFAGPACSANASIDNGSFDPDAGDTITITQAPAGPYPVGNTSVTLTVIDNHGASNSSTAVVTVIDNTAPTISCPANITVTAAPGSGSAPVSYAAPSATDNCAAPIVSCSRAANSSFPMGTTTVTCTATDAANNPASCAFTVTVLTPQDAVQRLGNNVNSLVTQGVLNQGNGNALSSKLQAAISSLNKGNTGSACNQLQAFINQTQALTNAGKLSMTQGQGLISTAMAIRQVIGC